MNVPDEPGVAAQTVGGWLDALASDAPTPGGGALAGLSGAAGCALVSMVARLTVGKKGFEDVDARMCALAEAADAARGELLELADRDAHAFDDVMAAFAMPKGSDADVAARTAAIQAGYERAAAVPLEIATTAIGAMELARDATVLGNPQAASDAMSGALALHASALSALANVAINAEALRDESTRAGLRQQASTLRARADGIVADVWTAFERRISR